MINKKIIDSLKSELDALVPDVWEKIVMHKDDKGNDLQNVIVGKGFNGRDTEPFEHKRNWRIFAYASVASCCILVVFLIKGTEAPQTIKKLNTGIAPTSSSQSVGEPTINNGAVLGEYMSVYYRYNGYYYILRTIDSGIQNNIEKCLYDHFYKIRGIVPNVSIALFVNGYYWQLDYAFSDTILYNEKPYLIDMSRASDNNIGDFLGNSGEFKLYAIKDIDSSNEIAVLYGSEYSVAYQILSIVSFQGKKYEIEPQYISDITSDFHQKYLGEAGPYDAFEYNTNILEKKYDDAILLKINSNQTVIASAIETPPANQPLPKSISGSVFENFVVYDTVQYKGHGIYVCSDGFDSDNAQKVYEQEIEKLLDTESMGGKCTYEVYQIKGVNPSKTIMVKYNNVYMKYDYAFPDTIIFNGITYSVDYTRTDDTINGIRIIRGNEIGFVDGNTVYEINQIDPSFAVIVDMSSANKEHNISGTMTYYKKQ